MDNDPSHKEFYDMGLPIEEIDQDQLKYPLVEESPMPKAAKYRTII